MSSQHLERQWAQRGFCLVLTAGLVISTLLGANDGSVSKPDKPYSFGLLPTVDYNADTGLGYGLLFQFDDKRSPEYQPYYFSHRVVLKRTTRGIAKYAYRFDSRYVLPMDLRLTVEARYLASLFEPYHGPGGAQTLFSQGFIDPDSPLYREKFYYTYEKRSFQANVVVQGPWWGTDLRWLAGLTLLSTTVDTVHYAQYGEDPGLQTLLARHWDLQGKFMAGGQEHGLLLGVIWDRRDHEASPRRGIWSEILLRWVPRVPGNDFAYTAITATHRQYVPLGGALTFAYRISGRTVPDRVPFFSRSRVDGSFTTETGLGGEKTVRGVLWQRMSGYRFLYGNLELRYRLRPLYRDGYVALSGFYDFGRTFDRPPPPDVADRGTATDRLHQGLGLGLRLATSATFIIALDVARPLDGALDGPGLKVYMAMDWLF